MDQFSEEEARIASRPATELSQEVSANTFIGQHFLTDEDICKKIIDSIPSNTKCIEIGAGPGTLTSRLLDNENEVVAYEVDQQFRPALEDMKKDSPLVIRWSSFLDADIDALNESAPFRLVGNIPYHISEPLMFMLTRLNFESATLLVGKRLATSLRAKPESSHWGRMSLLANAYFNIQVLADVPKESFYPVPRKNGALIMLTKKEDDDIGISEATLQSIVQARATNSTVAKALKAVEVDQSGRVVVRRGNIHKKSSNGSERRKTRITNMLELVIESGVNERILSKPLNGIANQELRTLCIAILSIASKERARHSKKQDRTAV